MKMGKTTQPTELAEALMDDHCLITDSSINTKISTTKLKYKSDQCFYSVSSINTTNIYLLTQGCT